MKRIIFLLVAFIGIGTGVTLAQTENIVIPDTGMQGFFVSMAAIIPLITFIAGWINARIKTVRFGKQAVSWLVSIALSIAGWYFNLGYLAGLTWWQVLICGIGTGLAANGLFDITIIKSIVYAIFNSKKVKA